MRKNRIILVSLVYSLFLALMLNSTTIFATSPKPTESSDASNRTYVIALDAGHGGSDSGAVNSKYNITEAKVAIKVAKEAKKLLKAEGHKVVFCSSMTTEGDRTDLSDRIKKAQDKEADICVSIHMNAGGSSTTNRLEVYIDNNAGEDSKSAAKALLESMENSIGSYVPEDKKSSNTVCVDSSSQHTDLAMTKPAGFEFPTVLLEGGFISCSKVAKACKKGKYQKQYAEAIADGVLQALSGIGLSDDAKNKANINVEANLNSEYQSVVDEYEKHTLQNYKEVGDMQGLTIEEREQVRQIQEQIDNKNSKWQNNVRVAYLVFGILVIVYSLVLHIAYWIDRLGMFFEIRLLPLVSFGKYEIKNEENTETGKKYVGVKKAILLLITGVILGMFILTGLSFRFINYLVELFYSIEEWF